MKNLISYFLLLVFLIVFMWIGVVYVYQNIQYSSARNFFSSVVQQVENTRFDAETIQECQTKAKQNGYQLEITEFENRTGKDAKIVLGFSYTMPLVSITKYYTIEGYTR